MNILLVAFALVFALLAWKKFSLAVGIFIILLPTYLVRFTIGPLPSTLLELAFGILFIVWLAAHARTDFSVIVSFFKSRQLLFMSCLLFFIASIISIFISDMWYASLGQWRAYFLEPILLFLILIGRSHALPTKKYITYLGLSTVSVSVFAIFQKFTGYGLPTAEWQNEATRRVTSFFTSPNAVGLYLVPIVPLLFVPLLNHLRGAKNAALTALRNPALYVLLLSLVALMFTKSLGSALALGLSILIFLFLLGYKKFAAALLLIFFVVPLTITPIRTFIASKDKSSTNRMVLWEYSTEFLTASPKNFVFGTGLRQFFRKIQKPHYDVKAMERLIYPHNIFLNFWTEIGLLGLVGFLGIAFSLAKFIRTLYHNNHLLAAAFAALLVGFCAHGLIDVPYFKNDLAFLFWCFAAMITTAEFTA